VNTFSLLAVTRGRVAALERLFDSLRAQTFQCMEVILVDQTSGDKLDALIDRFQKYFAIRRIRIAPCGISAARNKGLSYLRGDIIAFPDDDAAYPPGLLEQVFHCLEKQKECAGLSCFVCDEKGAGSAGGVMSRTGCNLSFSKVWKTSVSCSFFLRRPAVETTGQFDDQLGLGSESGCWSGEETDFLLRTLKRGERILYCPDIRVIHPQPDFQSKHSVQKAFRYGRGAGRVLRKHGYSFGFISASISFQLLRAVGALFRLRPHTAAVRMAMAAGRLKEGLK